MAVYTKKWNGSSWVTAPFKKWNGSGWVDSTVKKWNGSSWVQIYPETAVNTSVTRVGGSALNNYATRWSRWGGGNEARQGDGSGWGGSQQYYGYLDFHNSLFPGAGSVNSISGASFSGRRGGSGYYNNDQPIRFYRGSVTPGGNPVGNVEGTFHANTGAPGNGGMMSNRWVEVNSNTLNWLNGVSGKPYLYIYSTSASEYLNITSAVTMVMDYIYMPRLALFVAPSSVMAAGIDSNRLPHPSEIYHEMLIYPEEDGMTLEEILAHREKYNIPDISASSIITDYIAQPVIGENKINGENLLKVHIDYLSEHLIPEYSYDGQNYLPFGASDKIDVYQAQLPEDFDRFRNNVNVRVRDISNDTIACELLIEPKILLS